MRGSRSPEPRFMLYSATKWQKPSWLSENRPRPRLFVDEFLCPRGRACTPHLSPDQSFPTDWTCQGSESPRKGQESNMFLQEPERGQRGRRRWLPFEGRILPANEHAASRSQTSETLRQEPGPGGQSLAREGLPGLQEEKSS